MDDVGIVRPAGNSVTNPGAADSVIVTFNASATASAGTPAGSGTVFVAPGAILAPDRESYTRVEGRATNLPEVAEVAGTNAPTTSTTTSARTEVKTRNAPAASTRVMEPLARICPTSKLTLDTTGRARSAGHAVRNPGPWGSTTVNVNATEVAFDGTPHTPRVPICSVWASRCAYPSRVSARRQGCTETYAAGAIAAAFTVPVATVSGRATMPLQNVPRTTLFNQPRADRAGRRPLT